MDDRAKELGDLFEADSVEEDAIPMDDYVDPETDSSSGEISAAEITKELVKREKSRNSVVDFAQYVDAKYHVSPIHRLIGDRLDKIERGESRRLAIFVPPAIGKSRLVSELFPSYVLGRNPDFEIIQTSYNDDLTKGFGRMVRNTVAEGAYQTLFPGVGLAKDAKAMDSWKTLQGGEYKAEPWGGGLIGFHANILIIDDPHKGYREASNPREQKEIWEWFAATCLNRLREYKGGPGAVILIMQRFDDLDFGGRIEKLVEDNQEYWDIINVPSIAEEGDMLGREPGENLIDEGPNRRSIEELRQIRARDPRMFLAVHQQKPIADDGELFKKGEILLYRQDDLPKGVKTYITTDFALTKGSGDYSVIIAFSVCSAGHVWLRWLWREQAEINESVSQLLDMIKMYKPTKILCEKVGLQKVFGPTIREKMKETGTFARLEEVSIMGMGGKDSEGRAGAFAGLVQFGYVHAPEDAQWFGDYEYELTRFPSGRTDDQVDASTLIGISIGSLRGKKVSDKVEEPEDIVPAGLSFNDYMKRADQKRNGVAVDKGAIVLPWKKTFWDELYEQERAA